MPVSDSFSDEYDKTGKALDKALVPRHWKGTVARLGALAAAGGPHDGHADALTELRQNIGKEQGSSRFSKAGAVPEAEGLLEATGGYDPKQPGASGMLTGQTIRVAGALKLLRHLYLARKRGSHKVWILSLPASFGDWPSGELAGASMAQLRQKLGDTRERFSLDDRKHLSDCTQEAMRWCQKTLILLAKVQGRSQKGRQAGRERVSRWFAEANTDEAELDRIVDALQAGFKKILAVLGSGRLVLSDHPQTRGSTLASSEAFVFTAREPVDGGHIEDAFFSANNVLKGLKNWTRILVHELSHRELATVDKFYAWQGIKPVSGGFPAADALVNAESWAFFCADAAGALTDSDRQAALQ